MTLLFSSPSVVDVEFRQALLEVQGIACVARNIYLSGTSNEGRATFAIPELWVMHDADTDRARAVLTPAPSAALPASGAWTCAGCGEVCESQFASCWNCGADRPAQA